MSQAASDVEALVNAQTEGVRAEAARATYIGTKMADLPEAYRNQLPATEDQAQLHLAASRIRQQYVKDMRDHLPYHTGYSSVAGDVPIHGPIDASPFARLARDQANADAAYAAGGSTASPPVPAETPPAQPNLDNMTATQLIAFALRNEVTK